MLKKAKIKNEEIAQLSDAPEYEFPKYTTQIINLVNSNAQGTRPDVVGQMSDLIQEFGGGSIDEWIDWYTEQQPDAVQAATDKIYAKFLEMRKAFNSINKKMIQAWVEDLLFTKTYCGLKFQGAIIAYLASKMRKAWRLATVREEAKGIDGFIGRTPVQIKSKTYKIESRLAEVIDVAIVYYEKKKDGISIEYDEAAFSSTMSRHR